MKNKAKSCMLFGLLLLLATAGITTFAHKDNNKISIKETTENNIVEVRTRYQAIEYEDITSESFWANSEVAEVNYENLTDNTEEKIDESLKMGAKAFAQSVFDGSFIKNIISNKTIVEEAKEEYAAENIIIEENFISGEELINISQTSFEDEFTPSGEEIAAIEAVGEPVEVTIEPTLPTVEINGETVQYVKYVDIMRVNGKGGASAYCLCYKCCQKTPDNPNYGRTASGLVIVPGTGMKVVSVDPTVIPLKSKVYVQGLNGAPDYGYAVAADTGGAIKGNRVDLYMDSHSEALKWGRRDVRVYILPD